MRRPGGERAGGAPNCGPGPGCHAADSISLAPLTTCVTAASPLFWRGGCAFPGPHSPGDRPGAAVSAAHTLQHVSPRGQEPGSDSLSGLLSFCSLS